MYTLEDYLTFRGDIGFDTDPVNEIDEMVFASMGKADFTGILGADESGKYADIFNVFFDRHDKEVDKSLGLLESPILMKTLLTIARCPRYADVEIYGFVNKISTARTEQMSALTVLGPNGKIYVTFRGTDDTLVGWKENCELAILDSVPAQRDATAYLNKIAKQFKGPIVVSGHSKGGNLAVYAAANAGKAVQLRIEKVISYDGPGFLKEFFSKPGYLRIKDRIVTMAPTASIVGMLMNYAGTLEVIECQKDGPYAHDIFIWNLTPTGLVRASGLLEKSQVFHQAINKTLDEMDMEERQEFVNETFEVLTSTGAKNLLDFSDNTWSQALTMSKKLYKSKEIKQFIAALSKFSFKGRMANTIEELQEKTASTIEEIQEKTANTIEEIQEKTTKTKEKIAQKKTGDSEKKES